MPFTMRLAAAAAFASTAAAFPYMMTEELAKKALNNNPLAGVNGGLAAVTEGALQGISGPQGVGWLPLAPPPFDAELQYVSNTGANAFIAPVATDSRGPCPGLNAAANHGYIPRNGKGTITEITRGMNTVFGMNQDLGGFLSLYGAILNGDGRSWEIGGLPHTGMSGSHHNYECDTSPTRGDLNQYGNNEDLQPSQWRTLYSMQSDPASANYNLDVLTDFRKIRFQESIAKNPLFYYGAFDGVQVSQAAFTFIYRFMANKSAEFPEGRLDQNTLKSFFSIQGEGEGTWVRGHERIPDNWYKRHPDNEYSVTYFEADIISMALKFPDILNIGCNMGKVNTYNSISIESLTNGITTATGLLRSPFCSIANVMIQGSQSLLGLTQAQADAFQNGAQPYLDAARCPKANYTGQSLTLLKNCPGFSLYGGPTGPIAPGAIQG